MTHANMKEEDGPLTVGGVGPNWGGSVGVGWFRRGKG